MIYSLANIIEGSDLHYRKLNTGNNTLIASKQNLSVLLSNLHYLLTSTRDSEVLSIRLDPAVKKQIKADYEKSILKLP